MEKNETLKKTRKVLLLIQMVLTIIAFIASIYLLVFVLSNKLGGWMIVSYIFIIISIGSIIFYSVYGYKKDDIVYQLSILPFAIAVFINVLLPNRGTIQIALLTLLCALSFAFLLRQRDIKFTNIIVIIMIAVSFAFSIYTAITADTQFLGPISNKWLTYLAMYLSIFIPTIMSCTIALTYNVRTNKL